jgi:hypothetical protein
MYKKLLLVLCIALTLNAQENSFKLLDGTNTNLIYTTDVDRGLYVSDLNQSKTILIESNLSSSYQARISFDGNYVLYKNLNMDQNNSSQTPVIYDIKSNKNIPLSEPLFQCGVPSISKDGKIAFMAMNELRILKSDLTIYKKIDIGNYANISAISPDGKLVALNNDENQLYILDLSSLNKTYITTDEEYYYEPSWSLSGKYISYKNLKAEIFIYNTETKTSSKIASGTSLNWDGNELYFVKQEYSSEAALLSSSPSKYFASKGKLEVLVSEKGEIYQSVISIDGKAYYTKENSDKIFSTDSKISNKIVNFKLSDKSNEINEHRASALYKVSSPQADVVIEKFDNVYFNQVYDVRADRAGIGSGCCGAACAIMGLMYYDILPEWGSRSVNKTYSPYNNYLSEIYTFKGVTYNIAYYRSSGSSNMGYGAYGWIYRNNLQDTKGFQASYLQNHGLISSVDWSPTLQKAKNEIDNKCPLSLLNSLTTAGHYVLLTGYADRNGTLIFNDPYGRKASSTSGYTVVDKAIRVKYDYPGYSNGNATLVTAHCYIYMRIPTKADICYEFCDFNYEENKVSVQYKIINDGVLDVTAPFKIQLILTETKNTNNSSVLYEREVSSLSLTDYFEDNISVTIPSVETTTQFTVSLVVDAEKQIDETFKANNTSSTAITVFGKPALLNILPRADTILINTKKPPIYASFESFQQIDTASAKLYLNDVDITDIARKFAERIQYITPTDFPNGDYKVTVYIKNIAGFENTFSWNFKLNYPVISTNEPDEVVDYKLSQNYPNPFNPTTVISFSLPKKENVKIIIYDALGKEITKILDEDRSMGNHSIEFNASTLSSGTYIYRIITSSGFTETKKMLLLK